MPVAGLQIREAKKEDTTLPISANRRNKMRRYRFARRGTTLRIPPQRNKMRRCRFAGRGSLFPSLEAQRNPQQFVQPPAAAVNPPPAAVPPPAAAVPPSQETFTQTSVAPTEPLVVPIQPLTSAAPSESLVVPIQPPAPALIQPPGQLVDANNAPVEIWQQVPLDLQLIADDGSQLVTLPDGVFNFNDEPESDSGKCFILTRTGDVFVQPPAAAVNPPPAAVNPPPAAVPPPAAAVPPPPETFTQTSAAPTEPLAVPIQPPAAALTLAAPTEPLVVPAQPSAAALIQPPAGYRSYNYDAFYASVLVLKGEIKYVKHYKTTSIVIIVYQLFLGQLVDGVGQLVGGMGQLAGGIEQLAANNAPVEIWQQVPLDLQLIADDGSQLVTVPDGVFNFNDQPESDSGESFILTRTGDVPVRPGAPLQSRLLMWMGDDVQPPVRPVQQPPARPVQQPPAWPAQQPPARPPQQRPFWPQQRPPARPPQQPPAWPAQQPPFCPQQQPPFWPAQQPLFRPQQQPPAWLVQQPPAGLPQAPFGPQQQPPFRPQQDPIRCGYFMDHGLCVRGDCPLLHPPEFALQRSELLYDPQKPLCDFFLARRFCRKGRLCKLHHPYSVGMVNPHVRLNAQFLPLRDDAEECPYTARGLPCYAGIYCQFHHPEPGNH
ncbi:hypothetical protein FEM48_Zijuj09G0141500 [Ziziphus jujuba var. spinosa]|uniref:C3H1-type domain-containing protein n=1 Tax=Ziziphus jujuba var. spinosa TaxID=714518 RepID=A0A978UTF3_ZIZJJ|nr:hypothetical protein FEM48_Zijuj09G0141500 [Ziziphus jujuba var. spinosa]